MNLLNYEIILGFTANKKIWNQSWESSFKLQIEALRQTAWTYSIAGMEVKLAQKWVHTDLEKGIHPFDHALNLNQYE